MSPEKSVGPHQTGSDPSNWRERICPLIPIPPMLRSVTARAMTKKSFEARDTISALPVSGELVGPMATRRGRRAIVPAVPLRGELCIDTDARGVTLDGRCLELTPKEFDLLAFFGLL